MKKKIVVLTGAGVSAESGFATFRDTGGLWEQYDVQDVASIEGWYRNRKLVLDFYNQRREQLKDAKPNAAHLAIAGLEKDYDVDVVTQNVDNLHERAGSTRVLHPWMSSPRMWTTCTSVPAPHGSSTCTGN